MLEREYLQHVHRPGRVCALCGVSLAEQKRHPSVLMEEATGDEIPRRDFCPQCWGRMTERTYFSYWFAQRLAPPAPNRRLAKAERNEALWRLFNALAAQQLQEHEPHLFLLAHLLMKYGVLKWKENRPEAEAGPGALGWVVFEHPQTGEEYKVRERPLNDTALERVITEIDQLVAKEVDPSVAGAIQL